MSKTSADVAPFHYLKAVFAMRDTISSLVRRKFIFYSKARWSKRWRQCYSTSTYHHHPHHHHSLFSVCFLHMQGEQVFKNYFQAFMHLGSSLTFQSSRPLLITSLCVFLYRALAKPLPTSIFRHLLSQELSLFFTRWLKCHNLLFCNHFVILFNRKFFGRGPVLC